MPLQTSNNDNPVVTAIQVLEIGKYCLNFSYKTIKALS